MATIHQAAITLVGVAMMCSGALWLHHAVQRIRGAATFETLVPQERRERPFWSIGEFFVMFGLLMVGVNLIRQQQFGFLETIAGENPELQKLVRSLLSMSAASILATLITLAWLCAFFGDAFRRLGLIPKLSDIWLGMKASLWILPPVLLVSFLVSLMVPYKHLVLDTMRQAETWQLYAFIFVGTAVVAPIYEEFMFRVLLQGGLERLANPESLTSMDLDDDCEAPATGQAPVLWKPTHVWPIVVSSLFFALMHGGQGAAPIPLFLLALGLGYLYRQTGRITAPLIVHMVLNSMTLIVEFTREVPPT